MGDKIFPHSIGSFIIATMEERQQGERNGWWGWAGSQQKSLDKNLIKGDTNEKKLFLTLFLQLQLIESISHLVSISFFFRAVEQNEIMKGSCLA